MEVLRNTYFTLLLLLSILCESIYGELKYPYMENYCGRTYDVSFSTALKLTLSSFDYKNNWKCRMTIAAPALNSTRLMIKFTDIDISSSYRCDEDFLELFDGPSSSTTHVSGLSQRLCGESRPKSVYYTSGNQLTLYFESDWFDNDDGFKMIITPFHSGSCSSSEFKCNRGQCISSIFKCDGWDNCGDFSDECVERVGLIVGVVFAVGVVIAIVVTCICCKRRGMTPGRVMERFRGTNKRNTSDTAASYPMQPTTTHYPPQPQAQPMGYPPQPQGYPAQPQGYPPQPQGYPPQPQGYPPQPQGYPAQPQGYPAQPPPYPDGSNPYPYGAPK